MTANCADASAPKVRMPPKRKLSKSLPPVMYAIGDRLVVNHNGENKVGAVLKTRSVASPSTTECIAPLEYYMRFDKDNHRLDAWVPPVAIVSLDDSIVTDAAVALSTLNDVSDAADFLHPPVVRTIETVVFGRYVIHTWYQSPYPDEYGELVRLFVCQRCFKYMRYPQVFVAHLEECRSVGTPSPGALVYDSHGIKVYQIEPKHDKNLCLFTKLFLEEKTIFYDIESFYFYLLVCAQDEDGKLVDRIVGYFSKEKASPDGNNLATVLIFPPYQGKGYGRFMIDFSYALTRLEKRTGHPERPLSDLGERSYRAFWAWAVTRALLYERHTHSSGGMARVTVEELTHRTGIDIQDCITALRDTGLARFQISDVEKEGVVVVDDGMLDAAAQRWVSGRKLLIVDDSKIQAAVQR